MNKRQARRLSSWTARAIIVDKIHAKDLLACFVDSNDGTAIIEYSRIFCKYSTLCNLIRKKTFAEKSKILLNTDLKIILLDHQNNFVRTLKIMSNATNNFEQV